MRETWAALEWELSVLSIWGSRHFLTHSPSPLQEKLQLRRPLLELVVLLGVGWQESKLILLLSSMCSMFIFFSPVMSWNFSSVLLCSHKDPLLTPIAGNKPERIESPDPNTLLCTRGHNSVIYDSQKWKQLKCPLTHEWITNTWYIHTLGYHSVIKSIEVLTHAAIWQTLKTA